MDEITKNQTPLETQSMPDINDFTVDYSSDDEEFGDPQTERILDRKHFYEKKPYKTKISDGRFSFFLPYRITTSYMASLHTYVYLAPTIIYMSCCILRYPLYFLDMLRWIHIGEFPVNKGLKLLPFKLRKAIGIEVSHPKFQMQPSLQTNIFLAQIIQIESFFKSKFNYRIPNHPIEPLILKLIYMLFLPPEIYPVILKLLEVTQLDFDTNHWDDRMEYERLQSRDEIALYPIILLCCKLMYGFDNIIRHPHPHEPGSEIVDWELWMSLIHKTWVQADNFSQANATQAVHWDTSKMQRFINWSEDYLLAVDNEVAVDKYSKRYLNNALRKMFSLTPKETKIDPENESILFSRSRKSKNKRKARETESQLTQSQQDLGESQTVAISSQATEVDSYSQKTGSLTALEETTERDFDSDEELKLNGVSRREHPSIESIISKDLYSESNKNLFQQNVQIEDAENDEDCLSLSDSSMYDYYTEDRYGIIHEFENQDSISSSTEKVERITELKVTDKNLLEIGQLLQSTTSPYDVQLTKFTDSLIDNEKRELKNGISASKSKGKSYTQENNDENSEWEDVESETEEDLGSSGNDPIKERYEDALLYPNDYLIQPNPGYIQFLRNHVHSNKKLPKKDKDPAINDLRNFRYVGRLLRPGHRYKPYIDAKSQEQELVTVLIEAAPQVIGVSSKAIKDLFNKIERMMISNNQ